MRYVFDTTFFLIIVAFILNMIYGILIDSFGELQDKIKQHRLFVTGRCFICGLTKFELDTRGEGWHQHIYRSHNVYNYLYFFIMMEMKDMLDCNGTEKFLKEMMAKNDITYIPQGTSLSQEEQTIKKIPDITNISN